MRGSIAQTAVMTGIIHHKLRSVLTLLGIILGTLVASPSPVAAQREGAASTHPPTCAAGLREYADTAKIPVPYDTLYPSEPSTPVSPDQFVAFMRGVMARAGATGYIAIHRVGDADHEVWSFIPLFVPADTAAVYAACRRKRGES